MAGGWTDRKLGQLRVHLMQLSPNGTDWPTSWCFLDNFYCNYLKCLVEQFILLTTSQKSLKEVPPVMVSESNILTGVILH